MRLFAVAALLLAVAGCLDITSPDGTLTCSDVPDRLCPHGFYCLQSDGTCWRNGHVPEMGSVPPDFALQPVPIFDLSVGGDMSVSLGTDMTSPLDLSDHD